MIFTHDAPRQLDNIEIGPGNRTERDRAKALLIGQFLVTGGLLVLDVKGHLGGVRGRNLRLEERGGQLVASVETETTRVRAPEQQAAAMEGTAKRPESKLEQAGAPERQKTAASIKQPVVEPIPSKSLEANVLSDAEIRRLVFQRDDGQFRLNRKRILNEHKIVGELESSNASSAAREAFAAERAAALPNVDKVYLGEEADRFINSPAPTGTKLSADVVAVNRGSRYLLYESKGTSILHGLDQLKNSADSLGRAQIDRYELVIRDQIRDVGFTEKNGLLLLNGKQYLIHGKPVHVSIVHF